jgi:hypothetical protein
LGRKLVHELLSHLTDSTATRIFMTPYEVTHYYSSTLYSVSKVQIYHQTIISFKTYLRTYSLFYGRLGYRDGAFTHICSWACVNHALFNHIRCPPYHRTSYAKHIPVCVHDDSSRKFYLYSHQSLEHLYCDRKHFWATRHL